MYQFLNIKEKKKKLRNLFSILLMWNKLIILIVTLVCKHFVVTLVLFIYLFIYFVINVTLIMFINTRSHIGKHSYHLDTLKPTN